MPLTFADLIHLRTRDERRDALLAELSARGFPVTSWAAGGVARTLVEGVAQGDADLWLAVSAIARGGLLQYAEGDWLTELARSHYEVERIEATFARHTVRLSFTAGGPGTIAPGQLVAANPSGLTFRSINTGTETIPASGSGYLDLVVQCERAGLAGNSAPTVLVTPALAGLSMTTTGTAILAIDRESDVALRQRCRNRWATLAVPGCGTRAAYTYTITSARMSEAADAAPCGVTRVGFLAPPGDGTVPIRIAGASGLVSNEQRDAVRAWVASRKPATDTPLIEHAATVTVDLTGSTVQFRTGYNLSENRNRVQAAVLAYVNGFAMGDDIETPTLDESGIAAAIYAAVPGLIRNVNLTCGDVTVPAGAIAVCDETLIGWS